ncbi:MAG: NAD(P)-dependent oxidoreductase [Gemmataceae bacterium]
MRSLIIGCSGQVGMQLAAACDDREISYQGTFHRRSCNGFVQLDLRDDIALDEILDDYEPDVVFLPAAETHMDRAEVTPEECLEINVAGPRRVAEKLTRTGGKLVFFSTDHVFAECPKAMTEDQPLNPQSIYSKSKAAAETVIRQLLPDRHLILRSSWVFGPEDAGKNFAYSTVRRLLRGETFTVANDQFGQPTYGPDLADAALELLIANANGTFHVVGPDRHSKFTFARLIAHVFGLDSHLIHGVPSNQLKQDAPRPKNVWLSGYKLTQAIGPHAVRRAGQGLRELRDRLQLPLTASI